MNPFLQAVDDDVLACPFCKFNYTHIDEVRIGARHEDAEPHLLTVHAIEADVRVSHPTGSPLSRRRHWVEMVIDCEGCKGGTIVFAQHKGQTLVTLHRNE